MIGLAGRTITLSVMGGFEQSIKERVLSLTPQVQILNSQGSIENYAEIQSKVAKVPGANGSDAYIVGQAMLSSGRGIGGVVVRGVEPKNPVVHLEWNRYMVGGGLDNLARTYSTSGATPTAPAAGIAVGVSLAKKLKVKVRDTVRLVAPIILAAGSLSTKTGDFAACAIFD